MTIGLDIKEVLAEVGTAFTIKRDSGDITGEYLDFELNRQVTKPFIREFFLEANLAYDTDVIAGDVIEFDVDERDFIVMNKTSEQFENAVVNYESVLYKSNVSGEIWRFSGEGYSTQTYQKDFQWDVIKSDAFALLTERMFGTDLEQNEEIGQLEIEADTLFIPRSYGIKVLDRYVPASGEYYKVRSVEKNRFDSIDVCRLEEDTRE